MSNYFVHMFDIDSFGLRISYCRKKYELFLLDGNTKLSYNDWLYENFRVVINVIKTPTISGVNGLYFESESDYLLFLLKTK